MIQAHNNQKTVFIIGGGPSGLLTARHTLKQGYKPIILQKQSQVGGLWNLTTGGVWASMTTNLSKYTCCFQDHPWSEDTPLFPSSSQMFDYIKSYADKYQLMKYIKFSHQVKNIKMLKRQQGQQYQIQCKVDQQQISYKCENLVICTGFFSSPNFTDIQCLKYFQGQVIHSKFYKKNDDYQGKKILIVGGSFTAIQLASDIAKNAKEIVHCFRKQFWVLQHLIKSKKFESQGKTAFIPIDFSYNRSFYTKPDSSVQQKNLAKNKYYSTYICEQQQKIDALKVPQQLFEKPINVSISSNYLKFTKEQIIKPIKAQIHQIQGKRIVFSNGQTIQDIDTIILCTGYKSNLHFLPQQITSSKFYQEDDGVIYKQIQNLMNLRKSSLRPQFPYEYIKMADNLAKLLKQIGSQKTMHEDFINMSVFPALPAAFTDNQIQAQIAESQKIVKRHIKYI